MISGLAPADDATAAQWLVESLRWEFQVGSVVGRGFEAYARILHPAWRDVDGEPVPVRWDEVAQANDRVVHGAAEWASITGCWDVGLDDPPQHPLWDAYPDTGHLSLDVARAMGAVLSEQTTTADAVWFASWGMGDEKQAPVFAIPNREMSLYCGPLTAPLAEVYDELARVNLWWPADRAWCVGTDIDLKSTYVGGTAACVDSLIAHPDLEAFRVPVDQSVTWTSDTVNPRPRDPFGRD